MQLQTSNVFSLLRAKAGFLSLGFAAVAAVVTLGMPSVTHALTVSPARIEVSGDPGATVHSSFNIINEQGDAGTYYSASENFEAQGETGTPNFVPATEGLATWISVAPQVMLSKGQEMAIPFSITIPRDATPGGYFAAIFLSTTPPHEAQGQVSVGARIGVLVFLHVAGQVKEAGGLLDFGTLSGQRFFTSLPVSFSYRFNNAGSDRVQPSGWLTIADTIGLTSASLPANPATGNILPNSIRKFSVTWGDEADAAPSGFFGAAAYEWSHFAFGWYRAHLNLTYGSQNAIAESSYSFFVIPWQLLTLVVLVLAVLYFLLKRYNRYVIESAARRSA
jgi:hypothetical protein